MRNERRGFLGKIGIVLSSLFIARDVFSGGVKISRIKLKNIVPGSIYLIDDGNGNVIKDGISEDGVVECIFRGTSALRVLVKKTGFYDFELNFREAGELTVNVSQRKRT